MAESESKSDEWDASKGANPATCRHYVLESGPADAGIHLVCLSCGTDVSDLEVIAGRQYEWDLLHHQWVKVPEGWINRS